MLGLFGLLNLGSSSLQTQRQAVEIAGQNLANVNNPAYARQRLAIQTAITVPTAFGPQGTGVEGTAIIQIRNKILDQQIQSEISVRSSLEGQQSALQYAQANLGQQLDRLATGAEGAAAAEGVGGSHSLADGLNDLFNAFQSLSTQPTSLAERQVLVMKAAGLATQFNQIDGRLADLSASLNETVQADVSAANELLSQIATLNNDISRSELSTGGVANDLRDLRQQKLEELAKLVKADVSNGSNGMINVSIAGTAFVTDTNPVETLEAYDPGSGALLVRAKTSATPLTLTGGRLQGTIDARDGAVASLRTSINDVATLLITEVNAVHTAGFSLTGTTGANFFNGTNASDIQMNSVLLGNAALVQACGVSGAVGDNQVALALAQLANKKHASLSGQTFSQGYGQAMAVLGQALSSVNTQLSDQEVVENMMLRQRDSISGVSLDEEMTDLRKFQAAYEASARLITTVDEMLDTLMNLKR